MKSPICEEDIRHGKLCKICEAKLKAGQINNIDFELLKAIDKLENKKYLIATEIVRAFELQDIILVFAKGNVGMLIGKEGKNVKELSEKLGKKVRIIELSDEPKEVIQQILGRARVIAVNKIFKPESEELKVIVDSRDKNMIGPAKANIEEIIRKMLKKPVEISFS